MQRYYPQVKSGMYPSDTGNFVTYADALLLEKRVKELEAALRLLYLDVLQGADPASKECQERTGSFAKARAALEVPHEP